MPMSRAAESPKTAAETRTPIGSSCFAAYARKRRHGVVLLQAARIAEDRVRDVAVRGEADVVEHDLVEPVARGRLGDRDVVVPDALVVRVRPSEACRVLPHRAVAAARGHLRPALREVRILERDDAPDEVQVVAVHEPRRLAARRRSRARRRPSGPVCGVPATKPTWPSSSFTSSWIAVRPVVLQVDVLLELPRERGEPHGHVHAANLDRHRPQRALRGGERPLLPGRRWRSRPGRRRRSGHPGPRRRHRRAGSRRERHACAASSVEQKHAAPETARSGRSVETASTPRHHLNAAAGARAAPCAIL